MSGSQHNLDISKYSFEEILGLFELTYESLLKLLRVSYYPSSGAKIFKRLP